MLKGLVAGAVNLTLAMTHGAALPGTGTIIAAGVVGFFGYGVSLALFVLDLRHLGAARTDTYSSPTSASRNRRRNWQRPSFGKIIDSLLALPNS